MQKINKGFTLVEMILYVALVGLFVTSAISFTWDIIYGREKAYQQLIVDQSGRIAVSRIAYEIRRAYDVQSVSDYQIVLDNQGSTTTIALNGSTLEITTGGAGPYALTSNQVVVDNTNPIFIDLRSSDNNTKNIGINLTLNQAKSGDSFNVTAQTKINQSVELNSQFNQSRRLLVDLSTVSLTGGTSIDGVTLLNTGTADIVIDKMTLTWSGTSGGENVTEIQIDAGGVEWSGSEPSGTILDLTDYTLTTLAGTVNVNYITFDSNMSGANMKLDIVMSDGSVSRNSLTLTTSGSSTPTPTPTASGTPSPTPSPVSTCSDYCVQNSYTTGFCDKNSGACSAAGAVNESGGDQYCTGGPNADTCCCNP